MAAPSVKRAGVGFRSATLFALNSSFYPAASATSAYEGVQLEAAKVLTLNDPAPRIIHHQGDDRVLQIDVLPPTEALSGQLRIGRTNDAIDAILSDLKSFTVGESKMFLGGVTDQDGFENQVGILAYRQALDEAGGRVWESRILPRAVLFPSEHGFDENPEDRMYTVTPMLVTKHIWGTAFALATEGGLQAQVIRGIHQYKPKLVAWLGDGTEDGFTFPTNAQAVSTGKVVVWVNGVIQSSGLTVATTGLTFTAAPALDAVIVALYETA